jgi:hypothetical protein
MPFVPPFFIKLDIVNFWDFADSLFNYMKTVDMTLYSIDPSFMEGARSAMLKKARRGWIARCRSVPAKPWAPPGCSRSTPRSNRWMDITASGLGARRQRLRQRRRHGGAGRSGSRPASSNPRQCAGVKRLMRCNLPAPAHAHPCGKYSHQNHERQCSQGGLRSVSTTAPQLSKTVRWSALVRYIIRQFLACKTRNPFFLALPNQVIGGR